MAKSKARVAERADDSEDRASADGESAVITAAADSRVNKSEAIRTEARAVLDAGRQPRPSEIVRALQSRGIDVAPAMVSTVLKKMGLERRPRRSSAAPGRAAAGRDVSPRRETLSSDESFTLHQLIAAKKFVEMVGSPKQAMALLDALDRLT